MTVSRTVTLIVAYIGAAVAYTTVAIFLFVPFAMGECIPRSDPLIHVCDVEKQRELTIYATTFLASPMIAALIGWRSSARASVIYLLASSLVPFALTLAFDVLFAQWHR